MNRRSLFASAAGGLFARGAPPELPMDRIAAGGVHFQNGGKPGEFPPWMVRDTRKK